MPEKNQHVTSEQEAEFKQLLAQVGPSNAMRILSGWLSDQQGSYSGEVRDTFNKAITDLRGYADSLKNIRD